MKTRQICTIKKKFKKITTVVISNKLNHKNKIKKIKYTDIRDLLDNFNKNAIGETDAKIKLNALNELKKAEIKNKRCSSNQQELLKLFADLLKTLSNNNNTNSNNNDNESESDNENYNENESESNNGKESESESEDESEDKNDEYYKIKKPNGYFKMINETNHLKNKQIYLKK